MVYRKWTHAEKLEAVALGRVIGAEAAGEQLGMGARAVRAWMARAGDAPELAANQATWRGLMDLALSRTQALVASGKLSPTVTATIAGIAARNAHRDPQEPDAQRSDAQAFVDEFEAWAVETRPDLIVYYGSREGAASGILRALLRTQRMWEWERAMAGQPVAWEDATNGES